jgi:hypothetical protein
MDTNPSNPESREALLEVLALRLTTSPFDPERQNPQLFVGRLPENLPFDVPLPAGSRVIGSIAQHGAYRHPAGCAARAGAGAGLL